MPSKITDLTAQTGANAATGDLVLTVDVSDATMAATGTDKKMTLAELLAFITANDLVFSSVSATGSITTADYVFASGTITLTLPSAATRKRPITIKNVGTGVVTVKGPGAETIDGVTQVDMAVEKESTVFVPDGANWQIV